MEAVPGNGHMQHRGQEVVLPGPNRPVENQAGAAVDVLRQGVRDGL
jgi:hypothetical protein